MEKLVVSESEYLFEVRRRAYLLWERRLKATDLDDWGAARMRAVGLVPARRREEDIRWLAYIVYQERLAKTDVDDWLEAEKEIGRSYEVAV